MSPEFDGGAWRPRAQDGDEIDRLIARANESWARRAVHPRYADAAKSLTRRCLDLMARRHFGGDTRQRLLVFELNAHLYADNEIEALDWVDGAMECAVAVGNRRAIRRLKTHRAQTNYELSRFRDACQDLEGAVDALFREGGLPVHEDLVFALTCSVQLAKYHFFLANFDRVPPLLQRAHVFIQQMSSNRPEAVSVQSLWANLRRWQMRPELALGLALEAADRFERLDNFASAGRTHFLVAECALDLAERRVKGSQLNRDIECAAKHIKRARKIAHDMPDPGLADMVVLAQSRLDDVCGREVNQVWQIEQVLSRTVNISLLAQAWTALGSALASKGETDAALNVLGAVGDLVGGSEVPAFGIWAQRALFRHDQGIALWW